MTKSFLVLFLAFFLTAIQSEARSVFFECSPSSHGVTHQFSGVGVVDISDDGTASSTLALAYLRLGPEQKPIEIQQFEAAGTAKIYPAGKLGSNEVIAVMISSPEKKLALKLNIDLKGPTGSTLLVDGFQYRSICFQKK